MLVLRLQHQLGRLAGNAKRQFETSAALVGVRMVDADDGEVELFQCVNSVEQIRNARYPVA